ncbi:hypothetical protein AUJ17_01170 [Candidatus Micrarchaeota archaeon CG1_02_47_40]|nr:MAG: hypothetical protein AUJ17_01170 [Candidatus Micrarchaeota archaeon CG1_02_47_40]
MNEEFERRSKAVFEKLRILSRITPDIVFLGGSAIQALLKTPKRLSIDLDIAYSGDVQKLIKELEKEGCEVKQRKSRAPDFTFYNISKNGILVKLDIIKISIPETEKHTIRDFQVFTPNPSYFLASKLSALALDTIGRLEEEPQQILKDIFDINCILDLQPDLGQFQKNWRQIISDQNKLRKTRFTEHECLFSAQKTLLKCIDAAPLPEFFISPHALGSFQDMLIDGKISRKVIAVMAARALALSTNTTRQFYEIEKSVLEEAKSASKLEEASKALIKRNYASAKQITAIKTVAPVALMFLIHHAQRISSMEGAWIKAAVEHTVLEIEYYSAKTKHELTKRKVNPDFIGPDRRGRNNGFWTTFDHLRNEGPRCFKPETILRWSATAERFEPSKDGRWKELLIKYAQLGLEFKSF